MVSRRHVLGGLAVGAGALASGAYAEDRSGATSVGGFAGRNYATSGAKGALSLADLAAMPKSVAPFPVKLNAVNTKFMKGKTRIAVAAYGLYVVRSGSATAHAGGFGSKSASRRTSLSTALVGVSDDLASQIAEESYADLLKRLTDAGFEVAPNDAVQAAIHEIGLANKGAAGQNLYSPRAAPARAGMLFTPALSGLGNQAAYTRACDALDAIFLFPTLGIDYERLLSSGNHMYGANAEVGANLRFHAMEGSGAIFMQKPPPPYRGAWPGNFMMPQGSGTDEPFAIMYQVDDRSDSALVSSAMALAGLGSLYRQNKIYAVQADPDRYAALARAAFQGFNTALVSELQKARG